MFSQLVVLFIGVISLILELKEGNAIWATCGAMTILFSVDLLYQLKTGKNILGKARD